MTFLIQLSDDAMENVNIPDMSPKHRLIEEIHKRASANTNDNNLYRNHGNNSCLYSKSSHANHEGNVEVVSMESNVSYRDNNDVGKNTNPNFEWLERNVADIYDGSSKDDEPRSLSFQYDLSIDGNDDDDQTVEHEGNILTSFFIF